MLASARRTGGARRGAVSMDERAKRRKAGGVCEKKTDKEARARQEGEEGRCGRRAKRPRRHGPAPWRGGRPVISPAGSSASATVRPFAPSCLVLPQSLHLSRCRRPPGPHRVHALRSHASVAASLLTPTCVRAAPCRCDCCAPRRMRPRVQPRNDSFDGGSGGAGLGAPGGQPHHASARRCASRGDRPRPVPSLAAACRAEGGAAGRWMRPGRGRVARPAVGYHVAHAASICLLLPPRKCASVHLCTHLCVGASRAPLSGITRTQIDRGTFVCVSLCVCVCLCAL